MMLQEPCREQRGTAPRLGNSGRASYSLRSAGLSRGRKPMLRLIQIVFLCTLPGLTGCVVIPIGDLLKGPELSEQVLIEGTGIFGKEKVAIIDIEGVIRSSESASLLFPEES